MLVVLSVLVIILIALFCMRCSFGEFCASMGMSSMGRTMLLYSRLVVLVSMFFLILASVVSPQFAVCVTFLLVVLR